jgi:hypothetical protein
VIYPAWTTVVCRFIFFLADWVGLDRIEFVVFNVGIWKNLTHQFLLLKTTPPHTEDLFENRKITYFSKKNVVLK